MSDPLHDGHASQPVSVLLPAYEAETFIRETLDSLRAQTYDNFRVLISVDLCEDDTYGVCREYAESDDRFVVFRQTERQNYVGNCNFLLEKATGRYAMFAFHDDLLAPEYIERLAAELDAHEEAVMSFSDLTLTEMNGEEGHYAFAALEGVADPVTRGKAMLKRTENWWVPNRGLFRIEPVRRIGGLKIHDGGQFSVDWPWLFHMSLLGEFRRVPQTLCFKRYLGGSLSRSWSFTEAQWRDAAASCMRELYNAELPAADKFRLNRLMLYLVTFKWKWYWKLKRLKASILSTRG